MRTFFIIAASALLLAAITVELSSRIWPASNIALLVLSALFLTFQGYLALKFARPADSSPQPAKPARQEANKSRQPAKPSGDRETGTVKWFNRTKGFGFIVRASGEEIFVHQRSIRTTNGDDGRRRATLRDGEQVTFTVANREKGLQAEDVTPD
jgi:CspA family cold shock protein